MPRYNKGSVLRGAFGSSLKHIVCALPGKDCFSCIIKEKCAYTLIFRPFGMDKIKRLMDTPRGFVIKPPLEEDTVYSPEKPLSFEMVLIGDRINYLPYVIVTLIELGKVGMGLNRGRFNLSHIQVLKNGSFEEIFDSSEGTVQNVFNVIQGNELMEIASKVNTNTLTIDFLTPTRVRYNPTGERGMSRVVKQLEFHHLLRRLRDRANALSIVYCGGPIETDFKGIAELAMEVKTKASNLRWIEAKRKSRTQSVLHDQSGFSGTITFEGDLKEFMPLLLLGEYIHVGEDAVFGNGWYRIVG
jgi:hypothetical protein